MASLEDLRSSICIFSFNNYLAEKENLLFDSSCFSARVCGCVRSNFSNAWYKVAVYEMWLNHFLVVLTCFCTCGT